MPNNEVKTKLRYIRNQQLMIDRDADGLTRKILRYRAMQRLAYADGNEYQVRFLGESLNKYTKELSKLTREWMYNFDEYAELKGK